MNFPLREQAANLYQKDKFNFWIKFCIKYYVHIYVYFNKNHLCSKFFVSNENWMKLFNTNGTIFWDIQCFALKGLIFIYSAFM